MKKLLLIISTILFLTGYANADKFDWLEYDRTEIGFNSACSYYILKNPDISTISSSKINSFGINNWNVIHGSIENQVVEWEREIISEDKVPIYKKQETKYPCIIDNKTAEWGECIEIKEVFSHYETIYKTEYVYQPFKISSFSSKDIIINKGDLQSVRICANFKREYIDGRGWTIEVDHIPKFNNIEYPEWIWWNNSCPYRYHIDNNASLPTPYVYVINDTHGLSGNYIHALIANDSYVYSIDSGFSGRIAIANDSSENFWFNSTDCSGNNATNVYKNTKIIWCFDNEVIVSNETIDCSGNNNTGMCRNMVGDSGYSECNWDIGRFGDGVKFDGVNDYILGSDTGITGNDSRTVLVWANSYGFKPGVSYCNYFELGTENANQKWTLGAYINWHVDGYGGGNQFDTGVVATTGWHHHAVRYEGNIVEYFLDGVSLGTWGHEWNTGVGTYVGSRQGTSSYWNGTIDEVYVFNRSLSTEEIIEHYQNGMGNRTKLSIVELLSTTTTIIIHTHPVDFSNVIDTIDSGESIGYSILHKIIEWIPAVIVILLFILVFGVFERFI